MRRRTARKRRDTYTHDHVRQLQFGRDTHGLAWGDGRRYPFRLSEEATLADMRVAYPILREAVLDGYLEIFPGRRPWGWWRFETPEPRNSSLPEPEQLERLSVLTQP